MPILLDGNNVKYYKNKINERLESVGLSERRNHTPRELSGGQQQRIAIARALINEPDIILADKPIGNLDTKTGNEIMNLLSEININRGKTIIQVTHLIEASKYGDRVIDIIDGMVSLK